MKWVSGRNRVRGTGDAVRERRGLQREIGLLVVGVIARSSQRALEAGLITKLVGGLPGGSTDDRGVELQRVDQLNIDRLVLLRPRTHR